jgi:hypothetical protein
MKNQIITINPDQYQLLRDELKQKSSFVAEIDGREISDLNQFFEIIWDVFHFPRTGYVNYHAYLDWIRDLSWLEAGEYVFVIKNHGDFMAKDKNNKEMVLRSLKNEVLPWWEADIEQFQVQGKARHFSVFLVD